MRKLLDDRKRLIKLVVALLAAVGFSAPAISHSQNPSQEKALHAQWRPNKATGGVRYLGAAVCVKCHADKAGSLDTAMGRALETAADSRILRSHAALEFREGPYSTRITRRGDQSIYMVTDGKEIISAPIRYSFGQGHAGQTYLFEHDGAFYEGRLSFYQEIKGLDITLGHSRQAPKSLDEAAGRRVSPDETRDCVGCHSTGAVNGKQLHLENMMPGVTCEACHGPGEKHVAAMRAGNFAEKNIFHPGRLDGDTLAQEFCGSCHRSAEDVIFMRDHAGINNVRFQPYRIFRSKCYSDDRRISCTACHDPHGHLKEAKQNVAYYDAKCAACHQSGTKSAQPVSAARGAEDAATAPPCPVGKQDCVSCHMQKIELPGSHFKFTDHRIRVVRPGEQYPK